MPTYTSVDGVSRELTAWPATIDGVTREHAHLCAGIDGVQREIFPNLHRWEKREIWHYFEDLDTDYVETSKRSYASPYNDVYVESGFGVPVSLSSSIGKYVNNPGTKKGDFYISKVSGDYVRMYQVTSYDSRPSSKIMEIIESADGLAYPENGEKNGFWFIKVK